MRLPAEERTDSLAGPSSAARAASRGPSGDDGASPLDSPARKAPCVNDRDEKRELDELVSAMYDTLRKLAKQKLPGGGLRNSVDPTELLHECYLRLSGIAGIEPLSRPEFLAMAGKVIRHVVVDRAREMQAEKRGGPWKRITLHESSASTGAPDVDLLELDDALQRLSVIDERQARVVELRFFSGLSNEEIADVLDVSPRTVVGEWTMAKAWLMRELSKETGLG